MAPLVFYESSKTLERIIYEVPEVLEINFFSLFRPQDLCSQKRFIALALLDVLILFLYFIVEEPTFRPKSTEYLSSFSISDLTNCLFIKLLLSSGFAFLSDTRLNQSKFHNRQRILDNLGPEIEPERDPKRSVAMRPYFCLIRNDMRLESKAFIKVRQFEILINIMKYIDQQCPHSQFPSAMYDLLFVFRCVALL